MKKVAETIQNAPSLEQIKNKAQEALQKFYAFCDHGEFLSKEEYISALEIVVGVLYIKTLSKQSVKWSSCTLKDLKDVLDGKTNVWSCGSCDTLPLYGMRGIVFDEATKEMLKAFIDKVVRLSFCFWWIYYNSLSFHQIRRGGPSGLLLTNSRGNKLGQTAQYLASFAQKYIQSDLYLTPTILRKIAEAERSDLSVESSIQINSFETLTQRSVSINSC